MIGLVAFVKAALSRVIDRLTYSAWVLRFRDFWYENDFGLLLFVWGIELIRFLSIKVWCKANLQFPSLMTSSLPSIPALQ